MDINQKLLEQKVEVYAKKLKMDPGKYRDVLTDKADRKSYYQGWTIDRLRTMSPEDLYEYVSRLYAMLIWGNKQYYVDKMIADNGLPKLRNELADLVWGSADLAKRWNDFRGKIKGLGPAMMSEILCYSHPNTCMMWNRRAHIALEKLGVKGLPTQNYQITGEKYVELSRLAKQIGQALKGAGIAEADLVSVDYFMWEELQAEESLTNYFRLRNSKENGEDTDRSSTSAESEFNHDDVKDMIVKIGVWLGFQSKSEVKVAEGSKVDAIWEATIGNMGRVVYVFEVQSKGSIDSLTLNLLKSLNNPAVQGVVAVSDDQQLERIRRQCDEIGALRAKVRLWNFRDVLEVHENLEKVYESINALKLVPDGFTVKSE